MNNGSALHFQKESLGEMSVWKDVWFVRSRDFSTIKSQIFQSQKTLPENGFLLWLKFAKN